MQTAKPIVVAAVLAFAAFAVFATTARAASPESVERLLQVTKVQSQLETMLAKTVPAMRQSMRESMQQALGAQIDPERAARLFDALNARLEPMFRDLMSWERMKPDLTEIYGETFTQEEIDGLIAFYETPLGRAMVDKMPEVTQRSMQLMQRRLVPLMQQALQIARGEAEKEFGRPPGGR